MTSPRFAAFAAVTLLACACSSSSSPESAKDAGHHDGSTAREDAGGSKSHSSSTAMSTASSETPDATVDAPSVIDAGNPFAYDGPVFTLEAGVTWQSLYRDYFGPTGVASCQSQSYCHGSTKGEGYVVSGYLCPPGDGGVNACWNGMTHVADGGEILLTPDASFDADTLDTVLCAQTNPYGTMPFSEATGCGYYFTPTDIQRIAGWVAAGALDN